MKKFIVLISLFLLVGCNKTIEGSKSNESIEKFKIETKELIESSNLTVEEIEGLENFQVVNKEYPNEILERYNKIQGYIYQTNYFEKFLVEGWTDFGPNIEIVAERKEDYLGNKKVVEDKNNYKECKILGYMILPSHYTESYDGGEKKYTKEYCQGKSYVSGFDYVNYYKKEGLTKEMAQFDFVQIVNNDSQYRILQDEAVDELKGRGILVPPTKEILTKFYKSSSETILKYTLGGDKNVKE